MSKSTSSAHTYDNEFYRWVDMTAARSAKRILPRLVQEFEPASVLDLGCGTGTWLSVWQQLGIEDIQGVDGDYVETGQLTIPPAKFVPYDLTKPYDAGRRFDIAQCLEVGEHLPEKAAPVLVDSLTRHADIVVFSAAQPGQGGEFHVNEQPPEYWRQLFAARGYQMFDLVRPEFHAYNDIDPWYRFNAFVFLTGEPLQRHGEQLAEFNVTDQPSLRDYSSPAWKLRKAVLSQLPRPAVDALSRFRYRVVTALKG